MMLGEKVSATDAEKMGMIYKVYSDEEFYTSSLSLIHQLSSMPTRGLALTKKALNAAMNNPLDQQLDLEEKLQLEAGETYDYKEGVKAFIEKRNPEFLGK